MKKIKVKIVKEEMNEMCGDESHMMEPTMPMIGIGVEDEPCGSKITLANDYIAKVKHYLEGELNRQQGMLENKTK